MTLCQETWYSYFQKHIYEIPAFLVVWRPYWELLEILVILFALGHVVILLHFANLDLTTHRSLGWIAKPDAGGKLSRYATDYRFWVGVSVLVGTVIIYSSGCRMQDQNYVLGLLGVNNLWALTPYGIFEVTMAVRIQWMALCIWLVIELIAIPVQYIDPYRYMRFTLIPVKNGTIEVEVDGTHEVRTYEKYTQIPFQMTYVYFSKDGQKVRISNEEKNFEDYPIRIQYHPGKSDKKRQFTGEGTEDDNQMVTFDGQGSFKSVEPEEEFFVSHPLNKTQPKSKFKFE